MADCNGEQRVSFQTLQQYAFRTSTRIMALSALVVVPCISKSDFDADVPFSLRNFRCRAGDGLFPFSRCDPSSGGHGLLHLVRVSAHKQELRAGSASGFPVLLPV